MDDKITYARLKEHVIFEIDTYQHRLNELQSEEYPPPLAKFVLQQKNPEGHRVFLQSQMLLGFSNSTSVAYSPTTTATGTSLISGLLAG